MSQEETVYEIDQVHLAAAKEWMVSNTSKLNCHCFYVYAHVEAEVTELALYHFADTLGFLLLSESKYQRIHHSCYLYKSMILIVTLPSITICISFR